MSAWRVIWNFPTARSLNCEQPRRLATTIRNIFWICYGRSQYYTRDASATSHPTNPTRLDHFSTFFQFLFITIIRNHYKNIFPPIFSPWGGTSTDAGDGDGGGKTSKLNKNLFFLYFSPWREPWLTLGMGMGMGGNCLKNKRTDSKTICLKTYYLSCISVYFYIFVYFVYLYIIYILYILYILL